MKKQITFRHKVILGILFAFFLLIFIFIISKEDDPKLENKEINNQKFANEEVRISSLSNEEKREEIKQASQDIFKKIDKLNQLISDFRMDKFDSYPLFYLNEDSEYQEFLPDQIINLDWDKINKIEKAIAEKGAYYYRDDQYLRINN